MECLRKKTPLFRKNGHEILVKTFQKRGLNVIVLILFFVLIMETK